MTNKMDGSCWLTCKEKNEKEVFRNCRAFVVVQLEYGKSGYMLVYYCS